MSAEGNTREQGLRRSSRDTLCPNATPEERAQAVVEHFAASLPPAIRPQIEKAITSAIHRAVKQELAKLELDAAYHEEKAHGKGKSARGYDPSAIHFHKQYKLMFRWIRTGQRSDDEW